MTTDVSIIILSFNTRDLTCACLEALRHGARTSSLELDVIVIDNASADDSVAVISERFPEVRLYRNAENQGYARGVNQGLELARGRYVMLLGSDTEVRPGTLDNMVRLLDEEPGVGGVAPRLVNPDGSLQRACMRFPDLAVALTYDMPCGEWGPGKRVQDRYFYRDWDHDENASIQQPPGTCFMVRREVVEQVGLMDRNLWLFFNDVDWCLRIRRAGWDIRYLHYGTEVLHHLGASTTSFPGFPIVWHANRLHFYRKHYHLVGSVIIKTAMIWVACRELVKIRRNLESTREFLAHGSQVVRALCGALVR